MTDAHTTERKIRVFLVEDNPDTRLLLAQLLEGSGFEVQTAGSVQAALRQYPESASDVLVSDVGLPDGSGLELLRHLCHGRPCPYAIAVSGFATLSDIAASRAAGFAHHLVKPIEVPELERLLRAADLARPDPE